MDRKVGTFSDIHLGVHQHSAKWHEVALNFAEWAAKEYHNRGIDTVIIPGDIFHYREDVSLPTLNVANKFFEIFRDFTIVITTGNHDCFYKDKSDVNSISILNEKNMISVIWDKVQHIDAGHGKLGFVPWGLTTENCDKDCDIIFAHAEVNGFKMNNYKVCEHGVSSESVLDRCSTFITGHFHHPETRHYGDKKIVYVGSPYQMDFGDLGSKRGIYILDIKTHELEFIENTISPQHIKFSLSEIENMDPESLSGNIVQMIVDSQIDESDLEKVLIKINKTNPFIFKWDFSDDIRNIKLMDDEGRESVDSIKSVEMETVFEEFIDAMEVDGEIKDDVKNYCLGLYKKVS